MAMVIREASVESYVVRTYRRERDQSPIGVVELPAREKQVAFQLRGITGDPDAGTRDSVINGSRAMRSIIL